MIEQTQKSGDLFRQQRDQAISQFLKDQFLSTWSRQLVAGDASFRRYERLHPPVGIELTAQENPMQDSLILMDAPPPMEDINPFIQVTEILSAVQSDDVIVPKILAADPEQGFLLLSDFGDVNLKKQVTADPKSEQALYKQAVDILSHIQQAESVPAVLDSMSSYDVALYQREMALFADWTIAATLSKGGNAVQAAADFTALAQDITQTIVQLTEQNTLVLRDYHAENMMVINKDGQRHLGQLDYQDAVSGHPAYDLVSLTQDARRLISPELEQQCLDHYLATYSGCVDKFRRVYHLLGAQRALKIIGIFYRLFLRDDKATYLDYIPHMWDMLARNLDDPALGPLKKFLDDYFPVSQRGQKPDPDQVRAGFPVPKTAMVLAAGKGTRMGTLSDHTPKPLVSVAGQTLLGRVLDHCYQAGISRAVVNVHHLASQIEDYCQARPLGPAITIADERAALLETGGGVMNALPLLGDDPFYVINSDALWLDQAASGGSSGATAGLLPLLAQHFDPARMDILLAVMLTDKAAGYDGVGDLFIDSDFGPVRLRGDAPTASHMFAGVRIMAPHCFDGEIAGAWSMRRLFKKAAEAGRLFGVVYDGTWLHVGDPEALRYAEKTVRQLEQKG